MNMLIGIVVILILTVCFVYYNLNKQFKSDINNLNKRIDSLQSKSSESEPSKNKQNTVKQNNEYDNLKEQYESYVDSNNFNNTYEDLSETIKNEIDNIENNDEPLHQGLSEAHLPVAEAHLPVAEAHLPVGEDHLPVDEDHLPVAEAHLPVAEAHLPVGEDYCNILTGEESLDMDELCVDDLSTNKVLSNIDGIDYDETVQENVVLESKEEDIYNTSLIDIEKMTVKELQEIAKKHNVTIKSKERKPELIKKIKHIYNL